MKKLQENLMSGMVLSLFRENFNFAFGRHLNLGPKGIGLIRCKPSIFLQLVYF